MAQGDHLPDRQVSLNAVDDLEFANRGTMLSKTPRPEGFPVFDPETYDDVHIVAPRYDTCYLERE